jgi:hypothetical protein
MKWLKASEQLPEPNQEVLIRFNGMILLGSYDLKSERFVDKLGVGCMASLDQILWAPFDPTAA